MSEMTDYDVNVDYQTNAGNPATKRIRVSAVDEDAAIEAANERVRRFRNCLKIVGGDAMPADGAPAPSR